MIVLINDLLHDGKLNTDVLASWHKSISFRRNSQRKNGVLNGNTLWQIKQFLFAYQRLRQSF